MRGGRWWSWVAALGIGLAGCGDPEVSTFGGPLPGSGGSSGAAEGPESGNGDEDSSGGGQGSSGDGSTGSSDDSTDPTLDPTGATDPTGTGNPTPITCSYPSTNFGSPLQELDVIDDPDSGIRLSFTVPGLPAPELVSAAELRFRSYDADHPGEEGRIYVNDGGPFDLPANAAWDNAEATGAVDVLAAIAAGNNRIEFGPGPLDRSFFHIGDVELVVTAEVDDCEGVDDSGGDDGGDGVEQMLHYSDAEYTGRNNWVWRCQAGFDYAFTAANAEHIPTDCEGAYAPDGSAHGTATFQFPDVIEDDYLVEVHAYHTWNRNPGGARIIVDGVTGFVQQRTGMEGESYFETAQWGVAHLSGDVDIVLDSSQGGYASDAVSWIRIVPQ